MIPTTTLISLIGYRGTGKSTVAKLLASKLGWTWVDSDEEIERRAGKSIKEIFQDGGEPAFRDWESTVIADVLQRDKLILSLGGGAGLRPQNRAAIRRGQVIWLTADPRTIELRVSGDPSTSARRPNLTTAGGLAEIEHLLSLREPLYRECADGAVDTVGRTPDQVVDEIVCLLTSPFGRGGTMSSR
jgi:shikimate kinase